MLVSFNWLKEFVDVEQTAEEVADLLTMSGIEVEAVTPVGKGLDKILTARVEETMPHPTAPNTSLHLARISLGNREVTVVCGAPNLAKGQMVPYAPPGAVLPSGMEIKEREIKGFLSPGMICSEKELDLGEDASGILVLDGVSEPGIPLTKALPSVEDVILETSVTPNRGDCLSILGTAREVAAVIGKPWRIPQFTVEEGPESIHQRMVIEVPDTALCPRYVARMVEGVAIGPSPFEVRLRLTRAGVRPISNVVDATNLILLECGQPLHAFDYTLLQDAKIVVRRCDPGEVFVTLDGTDRKMPPDALMIRDGRRSVALGGIMGGLNSEIVPTTTSVLIESACFERFGIRRTAKALGMSTEASFRFERGIDPEGSLWAAQRAAYLIEKLAGGTILSGTIDVYPAPIVRQPITARTTRVNSLLGLDLTATQMSSYLERLGMEVEVKGGSEESLVCRPPAWRWDVDREVDVAEEVARIHGFQNVPLTMPPCTAMPDRTKEGSRRVDRVRTLMNASGFTEVVTMSFTSKGAGADFTAEQNGEAELALLNPLTEDYAVMRTSLISGLLSVMKRNINFRCEDQMLYEVGKTFTPIPGAELPREDQRLAGIAMGRRYPDLWHFHRGEMDVFGKIDPVREVDFFDLKGALENVLEGLGVSDATFVPSTLPFLHPGKSANVVVEGEVIGFLGELAPKTIREHDLSAKVQVFQILLEPLFVQTRKDRVFKPIPRYPYMERDLSFIVERNCSGDMIKHLISRLGHDIITSVILYDLYRGESIPDGRQSITLRVRYQSEDRTLTDEEVQEVHSLVMRALVDELGASVRE
jgi:phenylalanyl-tRNA synthetase beta chain